MPTGMEPHHDSEDETPTRQQTQLRLRIVEIERDCATRRADEYRKLLEQFSEGLGHAAADPADGQRPVVNLSSRSAPASATPLSQLSGPTSQRRQQPRQPILVALQDDGRGRQQRTLTPPEREPPPEVTVVRHVNLESREAFDGIVAALCADNSNRAAIFSAAGLRNYRLAPREAALARRTPEMAWRAFTDVFGGSLHSERPMSTKVFGYKGNMICASKVTQPFAPTHTGEPGVLLFHLSSSTSALLETEAFHVLVDSSVRRKTGLKYCGVCAGIWFNRNVAQCQRQILCRLRRVSSVSDLHARCNLRKRHGPDSDLSPTKIDEWKRNYCDGSEAMVCRALRPSFDSGHEKLNFAVIKCVGFDPKLAKIIEQKTNRRTYAH
ncbi:hypothetical protein EDB86DRAFT_2975762 [Lactarius hatsudake]|nr:hypothetical protein EDB86DRAFT_2975762 [Lactarius hatsudake]